VRSLIFCAKVGSRVPSMSMATRRTGGCIGFECTGPGLCCRGGMRWAGLLRRSRFFASANQALVSSPLLRPAEPGGRRRSRIFGAFNSRAQATWSESRVRTPRVGPCFGRDRCCSPRSRGGNQFASRSLAQSPVEFSQEPCTSKAESLTTKHTGERRLPIPPG
jgi:hypothetical protein